MRSGTKVYEERYVGARGEILRYMRSGTKMYDERY
jgi:hypothetical protein